jgi:anaerobic magnesium-protoporphyrin IX monomethyl ester cyclase
MRVVMMTTFDPASPTDPSQVIQPPLGLACMVAATRTLGHEVTVIDSVGEAPDQTFQFGGRFWLRGLKIDELIARIPEGTDLVGMSLMYTYCYPAVRNLVRKLRSQRPELKVVLGGEGFSGIAREVIGEIEADAIIIGEGETPFRQLLRRVDSGESYDDLPNVVTMANRNEILVKPSATAEKAPAELPTPDWSGIPLRSYWGRGNAQGPTGTARYLPLTASRGCAFRCKFCTAPATWGFQRYRPQDDVIEELREMKGRWGVEAVLFNDLSISTDIRWFDDFVEKLAGAELGLKWQMPAGVRAQKLTLDTLSTAKRSGLVHLQLAPETGSEKVMSWIEKRFSLDSVRDSVVNARKVGLPTGAFFIIGHPVEEIEDYRKTVKFAVELAKLGLDEADCSMFTLLPGSPRFMELQAQGKVTLDDDFYATLSESDLGSEHSNTDFFSGRELRYMRLQFFLAFYGAKVASRPAWLARAARNAAIGQQQLKTDRVFQVGLGRLVRGMAPVVSPGSVKLAQRIWA